MSPPKQALQSLQLHIIKSLSSVFFKFFLFFLYISYLWILGSSPRMTQWGVVIPHLMGITPHCHARPDRASIGI